jgi:triosephosphate isomerase
VRKPLVAGNWKMNGSGASSEQLLTGIVAKADLFSHIDVAVFPPALYLYQVQKQLQHSQIAWGTQNVSSFEHGPYTGEISATMLKDFDCQYVLIGHSERRCLYAELDLDQEALDHIIADKYYMSVSKGVTPIICIGETPDEYRAGKTEQVITRQLDIVINHHGAETLSQAVLAYEPVWAIGTGESATPDWAQNIHKLMRESIAKHDKKTADSIRILYGGSVKSDNARSLFAMPDIDGGLIGGASLIADEFVEICQQAQQQII